MRSPQVLELAEVLMQHEIGVGPGEDGGHALVITGADIARVGELAATAGVVLHELSAHRGSLEEAFMQITGHDVEYTVGGSAGEDDPDNDNKAAALAAARR